MSKSPRAPCASATTGTFQTTTTNGNQKPSPAKRRMDGEGAAGIAACAVLAGCTVLVAHAQRREQSPSIPPRSARSHGKARAGRGAPAAPELR